MSEVPAAASAPPPPPPPPQQAGPTGALGGDDYAAAPPIGPAYAATSVAGVAAPPAPDPAAARPGAVPPAASALAEATSADAVAGGSPARRPRLRWVWWTAGCLVFTALAGLSAYLAVVSKQWSDRVDDLTAISTDLGTQVSEQSEARKSAEAEAKSLSTQLDNATARITDLANEEANATDHEALWIDLVDALISCADERQRVIEAYASNATFEGISRAGYAAELTTYCDGLKSDYADFKAEIGK